MLKPLSRAVSGLTRSLKGGLLTISFEGASVSLLAMNSRRQITGWETMPFNPRLLNQGAVEDPDGVSKVIKNAMGRLKEPGGQAVAAYSGAIVGRILTLPPVKGMDYEVLIARELRRIMGTAVDYYYLFWTRLDAYSRANSFYVIAVPKGDLSNYMKSLILCGLRVKKVESRALALTRGVGVPDAVIANLGIDGVEVHTVSNFIPLVTTQRPLAMGIAASEVVSEVSEEVQSAVAYYNERNPGAPLPGTTAVYLLGRYPQMEESLRQALEQSVGRPVRFPSPAIPCPPDFPVVQYMVNVGLAAKAAQAVKEPQGPKEAQEETVAPTEG